MGCVTDAKLAACWKVWKDPTAQFNVSGEGPKPSGGSGEPRD